MKKLLFAACMLVASVGYSQTSQYTKIETTKLKDDKVTTRTIKYEGGTIDIDPKFITIDKEAPKPIYFNIASVGDFEPEDEGCYSRTFICILQAKNGALRARQVIALYTPKKILCDLIVKTVNSRVDYQVTDK